MKRIKFLKSHKISIENKMFELKQNFFDEFYRGVYNEIFEIKNKYSLIGDGYLYNERVLSILNKKENKGVEFEYFLVYHKLKDLKKKLNNINQKINSLEYRIIKNAIVG